MVEGYFIEIWTSEFPLKTKGGRVINFAATLTDDQGNRVAEFYTKGHAEAFVRYMNEVCGQHTPVFQEPKGE